MGYQQYELHESDVVELPESKFEPEANIGLIFSLLQIPVQ
jgi:hypothetical protein